MRRVFLGAFFLLLAPDIGAIPNSFFGNGNLIPIIPAFPRFNADLTEEFLSEESWREQSFSGPWRDEPVSDDFFIRRMEALPVVLGEVPMGVAIHGNGEDITGIVVNFLDAGLFFGYHFGGEKSREEREAGRARRLEFSRHYKELENKLGKRLEAGCGRGTPGRSGRNPALQTHYTEYRWENFVLRLVARENHSVSVRIFHSDSLPESLVSTDLAGKGRRDKAKEFVARVRENESGDRIIRAIPMFQQGETPFCGVQVLAMTSHYLGLRLLPEDLAAAADFRNTGSSIGSGILELHRTVADELGMRVSIAPSFDVKRVARSIEEGLPVIVWRRVALERESVHREQITGHEGEGAAALPMLTGAELEGLPAKGSKGTPSHASLINGLNPALGEVIYTEPWGEETRNRRMRVEEMEATVYAIFYFKL